MLPLSDFAAGIQYLETLSSRPLTPWAEAGLQRMTTLFGALHDPQQDLTAVQIAGTAGKGSTTAMIEAILRSAGYSTGAFTSPHLQSYRERIAVNGVAVDEHIWLQAMRVVQPQAEMMEHNAFPNYTLGRPAFLEVLWAMAALIFKEQGVRCAVLETGVGGRLDPVTVNAAHTAVITNVSLDHTDRLGATVEAIAAEKAGLIKPHQIVVSAAQHPALRVIRARCMEQEATLWHVREHGIDAADQAGEPEIILRPETGDPGSALTIITPRRRYEGLRLRLQGIHQHRNAACAVAAVDALAEREGLVIPPASVAAGLATVSIPGRMELIEGRPALLLDGAKGPAASQALAQALRTIYADRRIILLLGMLNHKDIATMTEALCPLAAAVIVAEPPWESHAAPAAEVAALARRSSPYVQQIPDVPGALQQARELAGPDDLIVVAGSLILVGAVRNLLMPVAEPPVTA